MASDQELIDYYVNLLIIQYINQLNARGTIAAFADALLASQIIQQVEDAFNLDNAVGVQLDAIGTYRGVSRVIVGLSLDKTFFGMPTYADPDADTTPGFAEYADGANITQYWAYYQDGQNPAFVLTDAAYRQLIKYKADLDKLSLGLEDIDDFLFNYFGTYVTLTDNGDMTITYTHDPSDPNDLFKIVSYLNELPHPAGVGIITV